MNAEHLKQDGAYRFKAEILQKRTFFIEVNSGEQKLTLEQLKDVAMGKGADDFEVFDLCEPEDGEITTVEDISDL